MQEENSTQQIPASTNVDRRLLEKVWIWLTQRPDVQVGEDGWANGQSLSQFENSGLVNAPAQHQVPPKAQPFGNSTKGQRTEKGQFKRNSSSQVAVPQPVPSNASPKHSASNEVKPLRVYASVERRWKALAGHGPDFNKIPKLDFACLSIIGAKREAGILQPELVRLSGQDKRSVPERTRRLHAEGYIVKAPVLVKNSHTSKLMLKRYFPSDEELSGPGKSTIAITRPESKDTAIDLHAFWRRLFDTIKAPGLITLTDLKKQLVGFQIA